MTKSLRKSPRLLLVSAFALSCTNASNPPANNAGNGGKQNGSGGQSQATGGRGGGGGITGSGGGAMAAGGGAAGGGGAGGAGNVPDAATKPDGNAGDVASAPVCTPESKTLVCNPLLPLPASIKDTGFFPTPGDFKNLPANVKTFVPGLQLWSDGLHKERQIILPAGKTIDVSNREAWVFPVGTIFLKTFLSEDAAGKRLPVETRVIRRTDNTDPFEQYKFDVYKWNESGTDATLLDIKARTPVEVKSGTQTRTHQIPSLEDCEKCHQANDTPVIGFDEVRLNAAMVAGGPLQLATFAASGAFSAPMPAQPTRITDPDPMTEKVKQYIYGNCVHCHNGGNPQVFSLRPEEFPMAVIRQQTIGSGTARGVRVVPGMPEMSILYRQMTRMNLTTGFNPMPPVGVQIADAEAVTMVRNWILGLR
jgi:hypothetical protein